MTARASFLALLLLPLPAFATVVLGLDDPELAAQADTIAFGVVVQTRTEVRDGRAFTLADVQVYKGLRGVNDGGFITVSLPGGRLPGGLEQVVSGAPHLRAGQMLVGFFETRHGTCRPLGLSFGLLDVESVGGELRVFRDLAGVQVVGGGGAAVSPGTYVVAGEPLDDYLGRIAAYVSALPPSSREPNEVNR